MNIKTSEIPLEKLPNWMRLAQRGFDWGLLLVLGLCLVVSAPFMLRSELPHTNANENYVFRVHDYATAISEGWLYPRWSPHVLGGYGAPIPNFYPPAAPYSAAVLQVLFTNSPVSAVRLIYILSTCIAGLSVYGLVMRRSDATAGILAAMLYIYAPYFSLTVPHILGDLPTLMLLALMPCMLWSTDRLLLTNNTLHITLLAFVSAALLLVDIKGAVLTFAFSTCFVLWINRESKKRSHVVHYILGLILGACISSFFWLPALLEQSAIQWQVNDIQAHFQLQLGQLFAPLYPIDPNVMIAQPQFTMGLVSIIFMVSGSLTVLQLQRNKFHIFYLFSGLLIGIIAIWIMPQETVLLGFMGLCAAIVGSGTLAIRSYLPRRPRRLLLPIFMIGIWIGSIGVWSPPETKEQFGDSSGITQVNYEQQGYGVAVLPMGYPIPSSLKSITIPSRSLIDSYSDNAINKLAPGQVTSQFRASPISNAVQGDVFQLVQASIPVTLHILTAYFPGWRASVGDQRLSVQPNPDTGLIQIEIPVFNRNNGELSLVFGTTDVRLGSWLISGISVLIAILLSWGAYRTRRPNRIENLLLLKLDEARLIALPITCFALVALLVLLPTPLISVSAKPNSGLQNAFVTQIRSTTGLSLNAFRLTKNVYQPTDILDVTLYWQAQRFLPDNYRVRLFLVNIRDEEHWNVTPLRAPGYFPTKRWNTLQYMVDPYQFQLAGDIPRGNYQIHIEAFNCQSACEENEKLTFYDSNGQLIGNDLILPTLISIQ